ncbi:MAG: hypothetical protein AAF791_15600 [Bacteroidota bacterium]
MPSVRPDPPEEVWDDLARRRWRRVRWRKGDAAEMATCALFGTPIHRRGTYYVRPAYTDGERWLSQQGYDALMRRTQNRRASRRSGERPGEP